MGFGWACMRFGYHEVHACVLTTVLGKEARGKLGWRYSRVSGLRSPLESCMTLCMRVLRVAERSGRAAVVLVRSQFAAEPRARTKRERM